MATTTSTVPDVMTQKRQWPHFVVCVTLASVFTVTALASFTLGVGSFASPDVGLWPFLASLTGLAFSVAMALMAVVRPTESDAELFSDVKWLPTFIFIVSVFSFVVCYPLIGFLPAAIPMVFVLLKYSAHVSWLPSLILSVVAPLVMFMIFSGLLNVRL